MKLKYKFLKKVLSVALITEIILNPVLVPWTIYAEDITPTPTPTVTIEEITPTPSPAEALAEEGTPTPTEIPSSTTTTGDSSATAQSDTTANQTQTTVEGQVGATSCTPEGNVSCPVDQSNSADVSSSTSADSTSGDNQSTNSQGDASITTGTASASATTTDTINTTIIEATPSATPEVTITITPTPGDSSITVDNGAAVETSTTADSTSGGNDTSGNGNDATIKTGDSYSSAAVVNAVNTTIIGSNYRFLIYNIYAEENATINLNEIWKEIEAAIGANASIVPSEANTLAITIKNDANVESNVSANATSGENQANDNGGNVTIVTGNSFASANLFNLINTNIIGANFVFVIINIFGTLNGDIVVPSQEKFNESMGAYNQGGIDLSAGSVVIDNYARVEGSKALADANSGNNEESGNGNQTTTTGKAYASATTIDVLNTTLSWENWMSFIINNFGSWSGTVRGWGDPSSSEQAAAGESTTLNHSNSSQDGALSGASTQGTNSSSTDIQNNANVTSDVSAKANSGSNQANDNGGDISISTGMAIALANVMNFINTNIFGGRFLFVFINIFGRWNGDFVLAHPDLQIGILSNRQTAGPGQEVEYTVSFANRGYEDARTATVELNLPKDAIYVDNSLGMTPVISGLVYQFPLGNVKWGEGGSFKVKVKINDSISPDQQVSNSLLGLIKDKIIAKAYAQGKEKDLVVNVKINTNDSESDQNNNSASVTTKVIIPEKENNNQSSQDNTTQTGMPKIVVESSHNVGEYVYPGDIVTFFATIKNTGNGTAHNVKVYQNLYDGSPDVLGTVSFNLGDLETTKVYKLSYGLTLPSDLIPEEYYSRIFAEGVSESGEKVTSEPSISSFLVKSRSLGLIQSAQAQEEPQNQEEGNVLADQITPPCKKERDYLPYVLSGILGILWFVEYIRRKRFEKELTSALKMEGL